MEYDLLCRTNLEVSVDDGLGPATLLPRHPRSTSRHH